VWRWWGYEKTKKVKKKNKGKKKSLKPPKLLYCKVVGSCAARIPSAKGGGVLGGGGGTKEVNGGFGRERWGHRTQHNQKEEKRKSWFTSSSEQKRLKKEKPWKRQGKAGEEKIKGKNKREGKLK